MHTTVLGSLTMQQELFFDYVVNKCQLSPGFQKRNQKYHPTIRLNEYFWYDVLLGICPDSMH